MTDRRAKIIIDGNKNSKKEIETSISHGSPISPILFLIYISGVFDIVKAVSPKLRSISFIDKLRFLTSNNFIKEIAASFKIKGEIVLRWGLLNAITYDIHKTEAILFSNTCSQNVKKEIAVSRLVFGG